MRFTSIACILAATLGGFAQAQLSTRPGVSETARRLSDATAAKQDAQAATTGESAARAALTTLADQAGAAFAKAGDPAAAANLAADQKRIAEALQNLSPDGKALLAQNGAAGAPQVADGPRPKPLTPEPLTEPGPAQPPQKTVITSDDLFFDSAKSISVFVGNVVVDSPQFHITCDMFEVHMRKQAKDKDAPAAAGAKPADPKAKASPAKPAPPKPDILTLAVTAPATLPGGGPSGKTAVPYHDDTVEAAIATGRKVVIIKHNPDGKIQIGQSRYSYYDGDTGDITLKESPQVQDGNNLHTAAEPTTIMVMTQAGALHTTGRSTTNLIKAAQETPGSTTPASGPVPAASGAVKTQKGFSIPAPPPGR